MAYTKHTWEPQELITADKLNNIEDGVDELHNTIIYDDSGNVVIGDLIINGNFVSK